MDRKFVKVSELGIVEGALSGQDRKKVKNYWTNLWGSEFATALVKDYKPEGDTQKVAV